MKPANQPVTRKCENCDRRFKLNQYDKDKRVRCFTCEFTHKFVRDTLLALVYTVRRPIEGTYLAGGYNVKITRAK